MEGYEGVFEMLKYLMSGMTEVEFVGCAVMHYIPMICLFIDYFVFCARRLLSLSFDFSAKCIISTSPCILVTFFITNS